MLTWMVVAPDERSHCGSQPWSYIPLLGFNPNVWKGPEHMAHLFLWQSYGDRHLPSLECFPSPSTVDAVSLGLSPLVSRLFLSIIHSSQR